MSLHMVASVDGCCVSDSEQAMSHSGHPSIGGHRVAFSVRTVRLVSDPLGLSFNGNLWFCRQLQNGRLLALTRSCEKHDPAIRKFQRIVMRRDLVLVNLPK